MSLSHAYRQEALATLDQKEFDFVIIGGGINGAGVARDAASRGLSVLLIEAGDFARGTSSRSSKLIHGGIRYLENLEFKLVFEALSERRHLFDIAPNLVHPLRFLLPVYQNSRVGMFKMGMGMWLYDILALFEAPEMHERLNAGATLERMPVLQAQGLRGSYVYSDAYMDDDRLVIETLRDAHRRGATCLNYVEAGAAEMDQGRVVAIRVRDVFTGRETKVRGRHFISTVGPWTDQFAERLFGQWPAILRPTKGIHITLQRDRLPLASAVVMADDAKRRIVFAIPRHEMVLIGTTDTDFQGDPAAVRATTEDVQYLLQMTDQYFPGAAVRTSDIVATYAGVRPLVRDDSPSESKTSREHKIWTDPRAVTFVTGGKYTTYRLIAQETVDHVLQFWPLEEQAQIQRSQTLVPLNPKTSVEALSQARVQSHRWVREWDLHPAQIERLVERHGLEAEVLLTKYWPESGLQSSDVKFWLAEAAFAIDETLCLSLKDFLWRRSPLFLTQKDHGLGILEDLADLFQDKLNWSESHRQDEMAAVEEAIAYELSGLSSSS